MQTRVTHSHVPPYGSMLEALARTTSVASDGYFEAWTIDLPRR